jgi:hypothetical protein
VRPKQRGETMKTIRIKFLIVLSIASFVLSACGAGQFLGSTITPSPTLTRTPTSTASPTITPTQTPTATPTFTVTPYPTLSSYLEKLQIINEDLHEYKFPESGVTVTYDLKTEVSKQDKIVILNEGHFPDANSVFATDLVDAMFRSWARNHGLSENDANTKNNFLNTLAQWQKTGADLNANVDLKLKFKAYWNGESEARFGEMLPPRKMNFVYLGPTGSDFDVPIKSYPDVPSYFWIYVQGDEVTFVIKGGASGHFKGDMRPESATTALVLDSLFTTNLRSNVYRGDFYTSMRSNATTILRMK